MGPAGIGEEGVEKLSCRKDALRDRPWCGRGNLFPDLDAQDVMDRRECSNDFVPVHGHEIFSPEHDHTVMDVQRCPGQVELPLEDRRCVSGDEPVVVVGSTGGAGHEEQGEDAAPKQKSCGSVMFHRLWDHYIKP